MNCLQQLYTNYKYYKRTRKICPDLHVMDYKLPSLVYYKYPKEHQFEGRKVLNIGCGTTFFSAPNVTNLDLYRGPGVNVVWDLSKTPLPFESNSVDLVLANHVLEHVPNWFNCFKELARIVKPGGIIEVWVPPISSDTAFSFRDHINYIGTYSFAGCKSICKSGANLHAIQEFPTFGDVSKLLIINHGIKMTAQWWVIFAPQWMQSWMCQHLRNVVSEVSYVFQKGN